MRLFSPDLSQVAFESETALNLAEPSLDVAFEAGPVGGPYAQVASIPQQDVEDLNTQFLGASADFSHVLFASVDHELPLSEAESATAEATDSGALDLYDWSKEHLQLVNATQNGSPLTNTCGATLGASGGSESKSRVHAVSEYGSKIFFTIPGTTRAASEPGCTESARLYMRVSGGEPIEVSAPEPGVHLAPSEILPVRYNYATPDGSKVFFNTETPLTSDDTSKVNKLFEYDTEAPEGERLKRIADNVPATTGVGLEFLNGFIFSEDGSAVYVESYGGASQEISRYTTSTGKRTLVAIAQIPKGTHEPSYSTPNGEFFLFTSGGVGGETRGTGHNELYRYDNADENVMCVTCGTNDAPLQGETIAVGFETVLEPEDETPALTQITEDGQEVFFQTTAQLVPQDTNSTRTEFGSANGTPGLDVYEWEAGGSEEAPGVFCPNASGCTHLLSSGEDVGPARLLGASKDGSDVFFESAARFAPQDVDEFPDIYDARIDGGFAPPPPALECLSCQGVGSPPPLFSPGASGSFMGAGNPATRVVEEKPKGKPSKPKRGRKRRRRRKSRVARRLVGLARAHETGA